nr:hypothetical protein CFP56_19392 [Quercus suber]
MASRILSAQSAILPNTAAAIAIAPALMGLAMTVKPRIALDMLDSQQAPKLKAIAGTITQDPLLRFLGSRDVYLGLSMLYAWYHNDRKSLGFLLLLTSGVVAGDGLIQREMTGEGEWRHWGCLPVLVGTAAGLLGQLANAWVKRTIRHTQPRANAKAHFVCLQQTTIRQWTTLIRFQKLYSYIDTSRASEPDQMPLQLAGPAEPILRSLRRISQRLSNDEDDDESIGRNAAKHARKGERKAPNEHEIAPNARRFRRDSTPYPQTLAHEATSQPAKRVMWSTQQTILRPSQSAIEDQGTGSQAGTKRRLADREDQSAPRPKRVRQSPISEAVPKVARPRQTGGSYDLAWMRKAQRQLAVAAPASKSIHARHIAGMQRLFNVIALPYPADIQYRYNNSNAFSSGEDDSPAESEDVGACCYNLNAREARHLLNSNEEIAAPVFVADVASPLFDSEIDSRRTIEKVFDWFTDPTQEFECVDSSKLKSGSNLVRLSEVRQRFLGERDATRAVEYPWNLPDMAHPFQNNGAPAFVQTVNTNLLVDILRWELDVAPEQVCDSSCKNRTYAYIACGSTDLSTPGSPQTHGGDEKELSDTILVKPKRPKKLANCEKPKQQAIPEKQGKAQKQNKGRPREQEALKRQYQTKESKKVDHFITDKALSSLQIDWRSWQGTVMLAEPGAVTLPHADRWSYGTWIHCLEGEIGLAWQSYPTDEEREAACSDETRAVGKWLLKVLRKGDALYMSPGTPHLVFRRADKGQTLALAGHLLRRCDMLRWLNLLVEEVNGYLVNKDDHVPRGDTVRGLIDGASHVMELAMQGNDDSRALYGGQEEMDRATKLIKVLEEKARQLDEKAKP